MLRCYFKPILYEELSNKKELSNNKEPGAHIIYILCAWLLFISIQLQTQLKLVLVEISLLAF